MAVAEAVPGGGLNAWVGQASVQHEGLFAVRQCPFVVAELGVDVRTQDGVGTDGVRIQNYQCTGADEQKWAFVDGGDGYT